jgi:hypothetical protein
MCETRYRSMYYSSTKKTRTKSDVYVHLSSGSGETEHGIKHIQQQSNKPQKAHRAHQKVQTIYTLQYLVNKTDKT